MEEGYKNGKDDAGVSLAALLGVKDAGPRI